MLIENYKVGTLKRYGLAYEDTERRPTRRLIYCSVTGFGQDGPYAPRPGYDFIFQGMGGLMSITGERDGQPGAGPQKVGIAITDVLTGMYASVAILAAITHRERTGQGQYIDAALLDTMVAFNANQIVSYFASGKIPQRYGNAHAAGRALRGVSDRRRPHHPRGRQRQPVRELLPGRRLRRTRARKRASRPCRQRIVHRGELIPLIAEVMRTRTKREWIEALEAANVPCGPINNMKEVFEDPQVQHRQLRVDMPHPLGGTAPVVRSPLRLSETPVEYRLAPPMLGQHNEEILKGLLGSSDADLKRLKAAGIV